MLVSIHTQNQKFCLPQQTALGLSRPARVGFYHVSIVTSPYPGPTDGKSSFYEEEYGLCFFHFVLLDIVFRSTSKQSRKFIASNIFNFKLIKIRPQHTVCVAIILFFLQGLAIWLCGPKPSTGDASWRTDYCDGKYLNRVTYFFC